MLNLIIELSLVFVIAALIGWLMGRYLCKSGEYEQRSLNKQLTKTHKLVQSQLKQREDECQLSLVKINQSETQLAQQNQKISALNGQLGVMNDERKEHLRRLQESSHCEARLNSLNEDYELEKQQLRKQREKNIELKDQLDDLVNHRNIQEKNISALEKNLQIKTFELNNTTKAYEDQADKVTKLQAIAEQQQEILEENKQLQSKIKLIQDENETLKSRMQHSNKDYTQLQEKCTELSEESLGFAGKLETLNNEKIELNQAIETISIEKNDYLGRLRAISSVVDVVGTEVVENTE